MDHEFQADIDAVADIDVVPTILDLMCRTTGMGFAAVARVTDERWIVCSVLDKIEFGLAPGGELAVKTTICDEIRASGHEVAIDNVAEDAQFCGHPTPAMYGFQSYISIPIVLKNGTFFGTLCAIDPKPAKVNNPQTIAMFKVFAELIAVHLDARLKLAQSEASLKDERELSEVREQFIAVLGHDLRNPVAAISSGLDLLLRDKPSEKTQMLIGRMQASVGRMIGLINNMLDLARGRMGGGLGLEVNARQPLAPVLEQVIGELQSVWPERTIELRLTLDEPVVCDRARVGQLLSNLVANALRHGAADGVVRVEGITGPDGLALTVANSGEPIPPPARAKLFQPFFRASASPQQQGLGLGLYIASEIARAHGGTLAYSSDRTATVFTFTMPRLEADTVDMLL